MSWGLFAARATAPIPPRGSTGWAPVPPAGRLESVVIPPFPDLSQVALDYTRARTVPAFTRGLDVIAGTASTFPLLEYDSAGEATRAWEWQPIAQRAMVEDLICYGWTCLEVKAVATTLGQTRPSLLEYLDPAEVDWRDGMDEDGKPTRAPYVRGEPRTLLDSRKLGKAEPGDVVLIQASRSGALADGRQLLRTALALEDAARRYADSPAPQTVIRNNGADLPEDTVRALLDGWESARKTHTTAYVNSLVEVEHVGFDPKALQLVEARQHVALEVARLLNLDPVWLGAAVSGQSLTYTNRQDLYRQLVDLTLKPLLVPIEMRLSAVDVLPGKRRVRFALDTFLRGNPAERMGVWQSLLDMGVITPEQVAQLEPLAPNSTRGDM